MLGDLDIFNFTLSAQVTAVVGGGHSHGHPKRSVKKHHITGEVSGKGGRSRLFGLRMKGDQ